MLPLGGFGLAQSASSSSVGELPERRELNLASSFASLCAHQTLKMIMMSLQLIAAIRLLFTFFGWAQKHKHTQVGRLEHCKKQPKVQSCQPTCDMLFVNQLISAVAAVVGLSKLNLER